MVKAVSFDIGGTLVIRDKGQSLFEELIGGQVEHLEAVRSLYKDHFVVKRISFEEFCAHFTTMSPQCINEVILCYYAGKTATLHRDVPQAIKMLKDMGLMLLALSNKSYCNPATIETYGLKEYFDLEIYSCDIGFAKPDVHMFRYAQQILDMAPGEIIHVGDSISSDVKGANSAAWYSVYINRNKRENVQQILKDLDAQSDYTINDLSSLAEVIVAINKEE